MIRNLYLSSCGILEIFTLTLVVNANFYLNVLFYINGSLFGLALETSRFDKGCNTNCERNKIQLAPLK